MNIFDVIVSFAIFMTYDDSLSSVISFLIILCAVVALRFSMKINHMIKVLEQISKEDKLGGNENE